jgi:hypothetical protein
LVLHRPRQCARHRARARYLAGTVKVNGADLERIGHYLDALEAKASMASGAKR